MTGLYMKYNTRLNELVNPFFTNVPKDFKFSAAAGAKYCQWYI